MPVVVVNNGSNNKINLSPEMLNTGSGGINIQGSNNTITVDPSCVLTGFLNFIVAGDSNTISIGENCRLGHNTIFARGSSQVKIGYGIIFNGSCSIQMHEPTQLRVGNNCLIASDTSILTSDMHSIVDRASGTRINPARDIIIEDNVWLGVSVFVLKDCTVGQGSIIGMRSTVTKDIPAFSLAAGTPAKVLREGVTWLGELIDMPP